MKILFVHREASLPSARVRVLALVPHLRALGVECETALHPREPVALRRRLAATDADLVVLQKKTPSALESLAWRRCRVPLVFDFDDAICFRQQPRSGSWESSTRRRRFQRALRLASGFACGNSYLASLCEEAGKPVRVVPSAVPLDVPRAGGRAPGGPFRVGWIGAPGNLHELDSLAPGLRRLASDIDLELVIVSEASLEMPGVPVVHVRWNLLTQEEEIARFDVGLMPLADSPWARGKCAYKLLQYMAAEVPAVASPVGMNVEVLSHGENGLLADSPGDFAAAVRELHDDPARARRLAAAGRATAESRFGYPAVAAVWRDFAAELTSGCLERGIPDASGRTEDLV